MGSWQRGRLLAERLTAQLLAGPPERSPTAVAERLLAIQGQDRRGARLAIRARSQGLAAADVDHALTVDRSLLITWLGRGTLHLVRSEDYAWLHAVTTPQLAAGNRRRLAEEGVSAADAERAVTIIERALSESGPLTRSQLRDLVAAAEIRTEGQALIHVLLLASIRGLIVRGPLLDGEHAYVLVRDWLGEQPPVDRERALAELARRFLAGHGPAEDRDLARWAGVPLRDARLGLSAIGSELSSLDGGLVALARRAAPAPLPGPLLLGAFDPLLFGWTSRDPVLGAYARQIVLGGIFRPFALVGGRAVARWSIERGKVALAPFEPLAAADAAALQAEADAVELFLAG